MSLKMGPRACNGSDWALSNNDPSLVKLYYLLTPWCRILLEKLTGLQLVKKFPAFLWNPKVHYRIDKRPPPAPILGQTNPHPTSWRSILTLSTHLRLGLPSGLFPSGFPTKTLYAPLSSPIRAACPAHLILLDFIIRTILGEEYRPFSSSLCNLPDIRLGCQFCYVFLQNYKFPTSYVHNQISVTGCDNQLTLLHIGMSI